MLTTRDLWAFGSLETTSETSFGLQIYFIIGKQIEESKDSSSGLLNQLTA